MIQIRKALFFKIMAVCLSICLFADTEAYAAPALRVNLKFDNISEKQDSKRIDDTKKAIESLEGLPAALSPAEEYSFSDFIKSIKFSDSVKSIKSDTGGQLFGRSIALFLLPLATCIVLILAPFVKISSAGPVFFAQERLGYKGKPIIILKLRTFTNKTDVALHDITPFGKLLRRTGLDEIPQILSIILGDMQWFGPRPYIKRDIPDEYLQRYIDTVLLKTKPGVFSWATLRYGIGTGKMARVDPVTVEHMNFDFQEIAQKRSILGNMYLLFVTSVVIARCCLGKLDKADPAKTMDNLKPVGERERLARINEIYPDEKSFRPIKSESGYPVRCLDLIKRSPHGVLMSSVIGDLTFYDVKADFAVVHEDVKDNIIIGSSDPFEGCINMIIKGEENGKTVIVFVHGVSLGKGFEYVLSEIEELKLDRPYVFFDILDESREAGKRDKDEITRLIETASPGYRPTIFKARENNNILVNQSGGLDRKTKIITGKYGIALRGAQDFQALTLLFDEIKFLRPLMATFSIKGLLSSYPTKSGL